MNNQSFTTSITVDQSPDEVFNAINNVRAWWSGEFEGNTNTLGDVFTYRYQDLHKSTQKITELVPGKKIVWHVTEATISFVKNKNEWKDTDIVFEISENAGKTELHFEHRGLLPDFECYSACSEGWGSLINNNLRNLIISGGKQPDVFA